MLVAHDLSLDAGGRKLLDKVSLTLEAGSFTVLAGPNGAGKSTLLRLLCGDTRVSDGQVLLDGKELGAYTKGSLARRRAVMPQEALLAFSFTAGEVVMMGRHPVAGSGVERDEAVVHSSMKATETLAFREQDFPSLSGGEKARVTLARVLAQESPLIFLDEPTASLDPRHQHLVMSLARAVADRGGCVLAVLHDLNLASLYADRILLLKRGRVEASGTPETVLTAATLEAVFDAPFEVTTHPHLPRPLVLSLPPWPRSSDKPAMAVSTVPDSERA
jgi:iron complex transport system ATP-binding protein